MVGNEIYEGFYVIAPTEIQHVQQQNQDCKTPTRTMSQLISQLSKHSLSETHDDHYFMEELDYLVESIRKWARLFSQGQPPPTVEYLKTVRVTERVRDDLVSAFGGSVRPLLNAENVRGKVRTRFVEVIMLRALMGDRLWKRHIGFLESDYESHNNLIQKMSCTEEETRAWSALTIHHLVKDNHNFQIEKEREIDTITDMVLHHLSSFSGSARATRERLREIVSDVAELGLEIARHPFEIRPISELKLGDPFVADIMKDVDLKEEGGNSEKITMILSYPWVKVTYDETGKSVNQRTYLNKARVSCISS